MEESDDEYIPSSDEEVPRQGRKASVIQETMNTFMCADCNKTKNVYYLCVDVAHFCVFFAPLAYGRH